MTGRRAYGQLVRTSARELFRDGKTAFFVLVFPLFFLAMFVGIGLVSSGGSYRIGVTPGPDQARVVTALDRHKGFDGVAAPADGTTSLHGDDAVVVLTDHRATVLVDPGKFGSQRGIRSALSQAHVAYAQPFRTPDGGTPFDPVKASLPMGLLVALMSIAFFGTATPLITLRQRGTLRLLGMTPLRRRTFVLAQAPVRLGLVGVQLFVLGGAALALGLVRPGAVGGLLASGLSGAAMLFSFGYLVAARMRSAEIANGLLALVMPLTMFFGGLFLPLTLLPSAIGALARALPTTYLVDALNHELGGAASRYGMGMDYLVLLGSAVGFALLAARLFRWDQGEAS